LDGQRQTGVPTRGYKFSEKGDIKGEKLKTTRLAKSLGRGEGEKGKRVRQNETKRLVNFQRKAERGKQKNESGSCGKLTSPLP